MEIVNPIGEERAKSKTLATGGETVPVRGKTVVFVNNGQTGMEAIIDQMAKRLRQEWGVSEVIEERTPTSRAAASDVLDRVAHEGDFVIAGVAT